MRARIPRPPLAVESSHCLTLNIMRPLSRSAAASSVLGVFRMLCISNFGVRNWPLVLVPGVNPFGRPELRCSGQCGDLNPLNPTRSTQCPTQNPSRRAFPRSSPRCSSRPCASSLISALRVLVHLRKGSRPPCPDDVLDAPAEGVAPAAPRRPPSAHSLLGPPSASWLSRPCASSLTSALRLLVHLFDSSIVHGDVAPYFAAAAPSLLAPLARRRRRLLLAALLLPRRLICPNFTTYFACEAPNAGALQTAKRADTLGTGKLSC